MITIKRLLREEAVRGAQRGATGKSSAGYYGAESN